MKVIINTCYGGFSLSEAALEALGIPDYDRTDKSFRCNSKLISVVEKLGAAANGQFTELRIVEIPDGIDWYIDDYDGMESIHEQHRSWS